MYNNERMAASAGANRLANTSRTPSEATMCRFCAPVYRAQSQPLERMRPRNCVWVDIVLKVIHFVSGPSGFDETKAFQRRHDRFRLGDGEAQVPRKPRNARRSPR